MKLYILSLIAIVLLTGFASAVVEQDHCYQADERYAVYYNGLWWAWLAPVAEPNWNGMGITPDASLMGDGWRNVAGEEEWALKPNPEAFGRTKCAAEFFFTPAPFCNWDDPYYISSEYPTGAYTYYITNNVAEFWVVHDDCGGDVPPDNGGDVPEFGIIAAVGVLGAAGYFAYRKRK